MRKKQKKKVGEMAVFSLAQNAKDRRNHPNILPVFRCEIPSCTFENIGYITYNNSKKSMQRKLGSH
ncbi:hypothetical protein CEN49_27560 [Fischerella thermalis CCMEE 5273]|nr:hypothetical protein CEN49_27560 [Fischerella thermalis CCMEE 5273]